MNLTSLKESYFRFSRTFQVGLVGLPYISFENKKKLTNFTKVCEDLHEGGVTVIDF